MDIPLDRPIAIALFWIAVACCAVAQVAIVRAAARTSRARQDDAETRSLAEGVPRPHPAAEVAWALIPAVLLALVLLFTWRAIS